MTKEEMEKLFATGKWDALFNARKWEDRCRTWVKDTIPSFNDSLAWRLIHKDHSHILDAYLDGCAVYLYTPTVTTEQYNKQEDFIGGYKITNNYLAVPKSLENCYCEATELHAEKLPDIVAKPDEEVLYYVNVYSNEFGWQTEEPDDKVKVEYNKQIQNWVYCPKEAAPLEEASIDFSKTVHGIGNPIEGVDYGLSKEDEAILLDKPQKPINNFEEYGFTADFEGEILKQYDRYMVGGVYAKIAGKETYQWFGVTWDNTGKTQHGNPSYNLTPIEPEVVYPIFKKSLTTNTVFRLDSKDEYTVMLSKSSEEIGAEYSSMSDLEDIPYDAERGLYHGQPIWYIVPDYLPSLGFFDAHRTGIVDGELIQLIDDELKGKIQPVTLEQCKTMDFIWEQKLAWDKD